MEEIKRTEKLKDTFWILRKKYKILERIGNNALLECKDTSDGIWFSKTYYDQVFIMVNEQGQEYIKPTAITDNSPESAIWHKDKMHEFFLKSVHDVEAKKWRLEKGAIESLEKEKASNLKQEKIRLAREQFAHARAELKEIDNQSEQLSGVMSNARAKQLLTTISQLDNYLKYSW